MDFSKEKDKISQFMSKTGADSARAKEHLQEHKWVVADAVRTYQFLQAAALPPPGPQKNVENQGGASTLGEPPPLFMNVKRGSSEVERRLQRGLSKTCGNEPIVSKAREIVLQDIIEDGSEHSQHFLETTEYSFILPDISNYQEDFKAFLHKDLIETSTLVSLEQAGRLNWWADMGVCQRLLPLATTGDGNCLLHAASLGMWGFHDRQLTLRKALHATLTNSSGKGPLWRRWRWQQSQANKQSGLILNEDEWQEEWNGVLRQSSTKPRSTPGNTSSCCDSAATRGLMERDTEKGSEQDREVFYESLEEFHVFVLANVLRRPIIVVADTFLKDQDGEALAPIPFGGVYLPLECNPSDCHRSPLLLTYDAAHFSALVTMEIDDKEQREYALPVGIPMVEPDFRLLTLHFIVDPGLEFVWNKDEMDDKKCKSQELSSEEKILAIKQYLDLMMFPISKERNKDPGDSSDPDSPRPRSSSFSGSTKVKSNGDTSPPISDPAAVKEKSSTLDGKSKLSLKDFSNNKGGVMGDNKGGNKVERRMQNVAKSFGSIGRSMSKKIKKMGGKFSGREEEVGGEKRISVGSATQSTKVMSCMGEPQNQQEKVLCAKLGLHLLEYQDRMVDNYLETAQQRFLHDRELKKRQDEEMKHKVELKRQSALSQEEAAQGGENSGNNGGNSSRMVMEMECINKECHGRGTARTSYLCQECFEQQKQEEHVGGGSAGGSKNLVSSHVAPMARQEDLVDSSSSISRFDVSSVSMPRQNTLIDVGKSKFYTYYDESQCLPVEEKKKNLNDRNEADLIKQPQKPTSSSAVANTTTTTSASAEPNNLRAIQRHPNKGHKAGGGVGGGAAVELARSSFYDESLSNTHMAGVGGGATASHPPPLLSHTRPVPEGTAFVNNLHNEYTENGSYSKQNQYNKPVPLAKQYTNQMFVQSSQNNVSPTRRKAFKIHDSDSTSSDSMAGSHDYAVRLKEVIGDMQTDTKRVNSKNELSSSTTTNAAAAVQQNNLQKPCREQGCRYFGTIATDFYCSACFKQRQKGAAYRAHKSVNI